MSRWLTQDDVIRLTGKRRYKAQGRALTAKGIRWKEGAGGEPLVLPEDVDGKRASARQSGPRWDRIGL